MTNHWRFYGPDLTIRLVCVSNVQRSTFAYSKRPTVFFIRFNWSRKQKTDQKLDSHYYCSEMEIVKWQKQIRLISLNYLTCFFFVDSRLNQNRALFFSLTGRMRVCVYAAFTERESWMESQGSLNLNLKSLTTSINNSILNEVPLHSRFWWSSSAFRQVRP